MPLFTKTSQSSECHARTGIISTDHGDIETPVFMPVGTKATVKSLDPKDILDVGSQIILANTYHMELRPGSELIDGFGGLHNFMKWDKPMLTDSGGFQVFSLGAQKEANNNGEKLVTIDENGVTFRSHIDGAKHRFTAESAIEIQHRLGADIIMAFDECTPDDADLKYATEAMERTHRWAQRCVATHKKDSSHHGYRQFLFGIIQGAKHKKLRQQSAEAICSMDFDGIAIGGESIGYNMEATKEILSWIVDILPEEKPRYTMGVGFSPYDVFDVVEWGVDMFDCVAPTRMARNGSMYVHPETFKELSNGNESNPRRCWIDIGNSRFRDDHSPLDPRLPNSPIHGYSRSYLYHLFKEKELLGSRLATLHNLWYLHDLLEQVRTSIQEDRFLDFKKEFFQFKK